MKRTLITSTLMLTVLVTMAGMPQTALADDTDSLIISGFSSVSSQDAKNLEACFTSDIDVALSLIHI